MLDDPGELQRFKDEVQIELVADNPTDQERLWTARRSLAKTLKEVYPEVIAEDIVVPLSEISATVARSAELAQKHGLVVVPFGHIGDGNVQLNILKTEDLPIDEFKARCGEVSIWVSEIVQRFGGSISAEHGVGLFKRAHLERFRGGPELALMRTLKAALDPRGTLNPGKVI